VEVRRSPRFIDADDGTNDESVKAELCLSSGYQGRESRGHEPFKARGIGMKVMIKRSGGYAGLEEETVAAVDTEALSRPQAQRVESAVRKLETAESPIGTDMLRYDIEVRDEQGARSLPFLDDGDPKSPLHELLQAVSGAP
jgi:hypothetical protein